MAEAKMLTIDNGGSADTPADARAAHEASMPFPIGAPNDAFAQYFVG